MSGKIVVIYDCPLKNCDKLWLRDVFAMRGYDIRAVFCRFRISNVEQRGKIGKLAARMLTLWQCLKGMAKSRKDDVVICWSQWSGLFFNMLPGAGKRYIISYNWLTPVRNEKTRFLYVNALQNKRLTAIINSSATRERILQGYGVEDTGNIVYIPDVFDDRGIFCPPIYGRNEKYCFSGGRANRDWELLFETAELCPQVTFKAVAAKSGWNSRLKVPENVSLYFDLGPEQYYELMEHSYMALYPLKEERVSGLINILKAVQMGKPVLTTKSSFTELYFPKEEEECLLPFGDVSGWKRMLEKIWQEKRPEYEIRVKRMQEHIQAGFTPESAAKRLDGIIAQCKGADKENGNEKTAG